jgi:myo-inositol 2-dehydrogenase/D-chiro-inositol 1-dehydrogenase
MIRFALFGAGRIGALHAHNIAASHPRAQLAWVHDCNAESARITAELHGARAASGIEQVLEDPAVDAVLIATPTDTHVDLILACAAAGKAILCEKPIDLDIQRVEHCRRELAGSGIAIQIAFNRRYDPSHRAVREAIERGDIGTLESIVITSRDPGLPPLAYLRRSGGLFRDMTIHDFDMARFLLGNDAVVEVFAAGSVLVDPALRNIGDVDSAMVVMRAASGALVHINNSRRAVYGYDQRIEAFGSHGMVQSENLRAHTLRSWDATRTNAEAPLLNFFMQRYEQAYRDELNDFIEALTAGRPPAVGFEDGRQALLLADAAVESLQTGRSVRITQG